MIHHFSIPAENPQHVAEVIAEVFKGFSSPFPPNPGSYIAFAQDHYGTAIEVYPRGTELTPGQDHEQLNFELHPAPSKFIATHAAVSVPISQAQIEKIGKREGWRVQFCDREGIFDVIEFWLENCVMLELLTPEMAEKYTKALSPDKLATMLSEISANRVVD